MTHEEELNKAAEESWALYEYREHPQGLYASCYQDGFLAGAKWAMEQGVIFETFPLDKDLSNKIADAISKNTSLLETFRQKTPLIFQIRKKDE